MTSGQTLISYYTIAFKMPSGRWKHDKYNELYGRGKYRKNSAAHGKFGAIHNKVSNENIVKLNFTNLAESVSSGDLEVIC